MSGQSRSRPTHTSRGTRGSNNSGALDTLVYGRRRAQSFFHRSFLCFTPLSLLFPCPNAMTHQPQIAMVVLPSDSSVPRPPMGEFHATSETIVLSPTSTARAGQREGLVDGEVYDGAMTKRLMRAMAKRPTESDRHRNDSRGVSVS